MASAPVISVIKPILMGSAQVRAGGVGSAVGAPVATGASVVTGASVGAAVGTGVSFGPQALRTMVSTIKRLMIVASFFISNLLQFIVKSVGFRVNFQKVYSNFTSSIAWDLLQVVQAGTSITTCPVSTWVRFLL